MGADLYWEERNFRPRPMKVDWDGDNLVLSKDVFYHGYQQVWRGRATPEVKSLIRALTGKQIPRRA